MLDAFGLGVLSALSLLLGAVLARFWRPASTLLGALMAFGGGALLAALTIEMVAGKVEQGHVVPLSVGAVLGGLLFVLLDQLVAQKGGFLRKTATTLSYVRRQERRRLRRVLEHLERVHLFAGQPDPVLRALASSLEEVELPEGATVYRRGDPCENLYVLDDGRVELVDRGDGRPVETIARRAAFGYLAFLTGTRHAVTAVTRTPVRLWRLPRPAFVEEARRSPSLVESLEGALGGADVAAYLEHAWRMDAEEREAWRRHLLGALREDGSFVPARPEAEGALFDEARALVDGLEPLADVPPEERDRLARRLFLKDHAAGHTFFQRGEHGDRLYVLARGSVRIVEGEAGERRGREVVPGQGFGLYSFTTGGVHTATAVATTDVRVGVLRRRDLQALLDDCPGLEAAMERWLASRGMKDYLLRRQGLDAQAAGRWVERSVRDLRGGRALPSVHRLVAGAHHPAGAPLAIWLGILLDGIPESFVIGTSLVQAEAAGVSPTAGAMALIVGLFLSNFPEALSSSVGMLQQGMRFWRVFTMWGAIVLVTGLGAVAGRMLLAGADHDVFAFLEGVAAGAMLTMIAETMLPEAFARGGKWTGLATLMGFLVAILVSSAARGGH